MKGKNLFTVLSFLTLCILSLILIQCKKQYETGKQLAIPKIERSEQFGINYINSPWKVNKATKISVDNMINIVNIFELTENDEDYQNLNKTLENEMILLFSKCDMKGEEHDQLHNYLLPLYEEFNLLKKGSFQDKRKNIISIKHKLAIFPLYFN